MTRTGIPIIGDVPWGTRLCQFYQDRQDLIDILVPYFQAGLENGEYCLWVTSEPISAEEAKAALAARVAGIDDYLHKGQLAIVERVDCDGVPAEAREYYGLRVGGDVAWLGAPSRMLSIRACDLAKCDAAAILDAVANHAFTLLKRGGEWLVLGNATPSKPAQEALHKSEERLRLAQDAAGIGSFELNLRTGVNTWTPRLEHMHGLREGSFGRTQSAWEALLHPDDRAQTLERVQESLETGAPTEGEWRVVWPDGGVHWLSGRWQVSKDADGAPVRMTGVNIDITERKEAEAALAGAMQRLSAHIDNSPLAMVEFDPQLRVARWSPEAEKLFGWTADEMLGRSIDEQRWVHEEDVAAVAHITQAMLQGKLPQNRSINRNYRKDGTVLYCEWHNSALYDARGRLSSILSQALDITARRQAQIARKEAEDGLRQHNAVLEGINRILSGALAAETEEELGRRCLAVAERVTGSRFGFLVELNAAGRLDSLAISDGGWEACRMDPESRRKPLAEFLVHGIFGRVILDGKGFYTNDPASHPDRIGTPPGHPQLTAFLGVPLKHGNKTIGMIAVGNREGGYRQQDLRRLEALAAAVVQVFLRKRAERAVREGEERLRHAQKMESIGVLAGGIAHDFNNLLTSILGNASLLQMAAPPGNGRNLKAIIDSSEKAAALTRQLLAYAGKGKFLVADFDVSRLVRSSADLLRVSIPRNIEFSLDVPRNLPLVRGDSSQIHQVVMNLVINAAEAIEGRPNGKVSVTAGVRQFDAADARQVDGGIVAGRYVWIVVSDNGCGMDDRTKSRIFEPFFTTKFAGRGLGLAAVHGILRSHQGAITVESEPGRGTTFTVYLPCREEDSVATRSHSIRLAGRRGATVLVVDDDEPVREFTKAALERFGHKVLVAENGGLALEILAARQDIQLVLLDVTMPVVDGPAAFSEIRTRWPNVAVLIASGYTQQEVCRLGMPEDAPFLPKPYTVKMLAGAVEQALQPIGRSKTRRGWSNSQLT